MTNEERDALARRVTEKVRRLGHWGKGMVDADGEVCQGIGETPEGNPEPYYRDYDNHVIFCREGDEPLDLDEAGTAGVLFARILDQSPEASIVNYDADDVDEGEPAAIVSWSVRHETKADTWQRAVALAYLEVGE